MAQSGKPWHICDDCLDPLAHDLLSIAHRFYRYFDVAKADRLAAEYRQIQEDSAYSDDRLTDAQRKRRDELLEQMRAQTDPPRAFDVDSLYRQYHIDLAIDWLKFNVSVEYAEDFQRTLNDAKKRFSALEFKACQIINGDEGKESTIVVRYPIQRLTDRHYEVLRETFPDHESHPDREELPDDLRAFEVEILDEYTETEKQIREAGNYLRRVSALVRSKMKKSDVGDIQRQIAEGFQAAQAGLVGRDITDTIIEAGNAAQGDDEAEATKPTGKPATVNERMAGTIMENPDAMGWNSVQWAKHLKCGKSSVVETATWKKLESARLQAKAERMKDRRRKPKASDSRRD